MAVGLLVLGCAKLVEVAETVTASAESSAPEVEQPSSATPSAPIEEVVETSEDNFISANTIELLGAQGLSKQKITINAGESVVFVNKNPSGLDSYKNEVIVFQDQNRKVFNSPQIPYEREYVHTFTEAGRYTFWSVGYGIQGEILVE